MKVISWNEIINAPQNYKQFFSKGTGISVGSFDGIHLGHQKLLNSLVLNCKKNNYISGIITFYRPLPSIKHSEDYKGDITTLKQRLDIFEQFSIDFVIFVDFTESFAALSGTQFLELLITTCNLKLLAEGIDFRCGYKGATDTQAIRYWANKNNIQTIFEDSVFFNEGTEEEERVSSSFIREMILKGFFTTVNQLLKRNYSIDLSDVFVTENDNNRNNQIYKIDKSHILQVIPPNCVYHCKNENNDDVRVDITNLQLILDRSAKKILF